MPSPRSRTRRFSSNPKSCTRPTNLGLEVMGRLWGVVGRSIWSLTCANLIWLQVRLKENEEKHRKTPFIRVSMGSSRLVQGSLCVFFELKNCKHLRWCYVTWKGSAHLRFRKQFFLWVSDFDGKNTLQKITHQKSWRTEGWWSIFKHNLLITSKKCVWTSLIEFQRFPKSTNFRKMSRENASSSGAFRFILWQWLGENANEHFFGRSGHFAVTKQST